MEILKPGRTALLLCILYLGLIMVCVVWAQFITDPKGKFVVLQVPVALQHNLLRIGGMTSLLHGVSWPMLYLALATPFVLLLVLAGNAIEMAVVRLRRLLS